SPALRIVARARAVGARREAVHGHPLHGLFPRVVAADDEIAVEERLARALAVDGVVVAAHPDRSVLRLRDRRVRADEPHGQARLALRVAVVAAAGLVAPPFAAARASLARRRHEADRSEAE